MVEELNKKQSFKWQQRVLLILILVVVGAIWFLLWHGKSEDEICNVVLISIDTCRADHLGCYGYPRKTTPNIDAIARESILFERVVTPVPVTLPAHSTMLTRTIPPYHGVYANINYRLGDFNVTLAEILRAHGYETGAVIGSFVMEAQFGLAQGFNTYDDRFLGDREPGFLSERRAKEVSYLAEIWLEEHAGEKFFFFLHYFDPHHEYVPPEPFATDFADNLYAGEIAYTDHYVGEVVDKLKSLGLYDSTLIIITGDHGESFGEHGEYTHGYFVYDSTLKVPLIFKLPGGSNPKRVKDVVGLVDVVPTILRYLDIPVPLQVQGEDLSVYFGRKAVNRGNRYFYCGSIFPTFMGCSPLRGIVNNDWKYIHTTRPELYDLSSDPAEENNLFKKEPKRANLLKSRLVAILNEQGRPSDADSRFRPDQESLNRLKSLGYLGGGVSESYKLDVGRDDPKDFVALWNKAVDMLALLHRGQVEEAKIACRKILEKRPDLASIHGFLGSILKEEGDNEGAIYHFSEALKGDSYNKSNNAEYHCSLADVLAKQGKQDEAISHYTEAIRMNPNYAEAHCHIANVLSMRGSISESILHYSEAVRLNPNHSEAHYHLANALAVQKKFDEAIGHFLEAIELKPDLAIIHYHFADCLVKVGRVEEAIFEYREALRLSPDRPEPANALALVLATHKSAKVHSAAEAVKLSELACEKTGYSNPNFLNTLAVAYAAAGRDDDAIRTAEKALDLARSAGQENIVRAIQKSLEIYKHEQP